jgi:hypothetical protein
MKRIITFMPIMIVCSFAGFSQTHISGSISNNSTWNVSGSPYIIDGNTLIQAGVKVIIDPGVIVEFTYNTTLLIDGELDATGDSLNHILITSNSDNPSAGEWNNIHFTSSAVPAIYDTSGMYLSGSIMKYCDVAYGGSLNTGILEIDNAAPYITDCSIKFSSSDGIYLLKGYSKIENNLISNNEGSGIYSSRHGLYHDIHINGNDINNNGKSGIYVDDMWQNAIFIIKNNIADNSNKGIYINSNGGSGTGDIIINENSISGNIADTGAGIFINGGFDINISCNLIQQNIANGEGGAMYIFRGDNPYVVTIYGNSIISNTSVTGDILYLYFGTSYSTSFEIKDNQIDDNIASSSNSILYLKGGITIDVFHIHNNSIKGNSGYSTFDLITFNGEINQNNIFNNTIYEIYNTNLAGTLNINATNNYWFGISNIDSKIYDFFEDGSLSVVYYNPILSDSASINTCVPPVITNAGTFKYQTADMIIYPNPVKDIFMIETSCKTKESTLTIYDLNGQEIKKQNLNELKTQIDISCLPSGIYFLKLVSTTRIETKKIIKE